MSRHEIWRENHLGFRFKCWWVLHLSVSHFTVRAHSTSKPQNVLKFPRCTCYCRNMADTESNFKSDPADHSYLLPIWKAKQKQLNNWERGHAENKQVTRCFSSTQIRHSVVLRQTLARAGVWIKMLNMCITKTTKTFIATVYDEFLFSCNYFARLNRRRIKCTIWARRQHIGSTNTKISWCNIYVTHFPTTQHWLHELDFVICLTSF